MATAVLTEKLSCPVCGCGLRRRMLEVDGYALWACRACKARTIHPRPEGPPEDLYDEDYYMGRKEGAGYASYVGGHDAVYAPWVYGQVRDRLLRAFPERGRLLDFGCADGALVEAAARDGWEATGIDASAYAVAQGRGRGLDLRAATMAGAGLPEAHFDVITTLHTVEHLPDPLGDLREARRIARDGALLVVEVPNARSLGFLVRRERWSQLKLPEHINFFDRRSLARLLRRAGWRPIASDTIYFTDVTVAVATAGRPGLRKAAGIVAGLAERLGVVRAIEKLGFGGFLRMIAVADPTARKES